MAINFDSDKFQSFNHREELDSAEQFQFGPMAPLLMMHAIYSAGLSMSMGLATSAKGTREVRPSLLVRESSMQLIMHSLDRYILYILTDFQESERLHR